MKRCWLMLLLLTGLLVGCAKRTEEKQTREQSADDPAPKTVLNKQPLEESQPLKIAVIPKGTTHVFWKSVHYGAAKAAKEYDNVEVLWKGPLQENDREGQINVVQDFITKNVNGMVLAPLDSQALIDVVQESKENQIPVVIFDSGLDGHHSNYVNYVATENFNGGALAAHEMGKLLKGQGDVILLRYTQGSESTTQREEGFLQTLKTEFPDINILVEDEYLETTPELSLTNAQQILQKHEKAVDGVFAVCEPNAVGTLKALEELGLAGKVKFIAFDPSPELIQGMKDGTVHGIVLQDPVTMGYQALHSMVKYLRGKEVDKRVGTGEFLATPENMETEQMKTLLEPAQFAE